jgi:diadenosine tetraphosphate (Ap4A) HIT family hydrolase
VVRDKPCGLCNLIEKVEQGQAPWAVDHGEVVSLKPFGAVTPMHRMFVPKVHVVYAHEMPEVTGACFTEAARWASGKMSGGEVIPFNLIVQSGRAAGQGTWHLHIHYVPRKSGDGLGYRWKKAK